MSGINPTKRKVVEMVRYVVIAKTSQVLADKASKMYDKLRIFAEHMEALGERLGKSQDSYANAMNVLKTGRGNLISQASQFESLGVQSKKRLPDALIESTELEPMSLND